MIAYTTRDLARARLHARRIVLEEEIAAKWAFRRWYRTVARDLFGNRWADLEAANTIELRRLIRDLRAARRAS